MNVRKINNNFGAGAFRALGAAGYLRYLGQTLRCLPRVMDTRNLRPVDMAMHGLLDVRHPLDGQHVRIDLDSYRAGDDAEGTYAFGLVREIWMRDIYLSHFALPSRLGCVIDLGANRGIFALQAAMIAERVVAVEPLTAYARPLATNLALNGLANVRVVNALVGGKALLEGAEVPTLPLSEVLAMAGNLPVDLLKIDIEGSEFGLDLDSLTAVRRVAMEVHPQWGRPEALVAKLATLGFECRTYDDALTRVPAERSDFVLAINTSSAARWANP